jgi:hypothetical protein
MQSLCDLSRGNTPQIDPFMTLFGLVLIVIEV